MKLESIIDFVDFGLSSTNALTLFLTTRRDFQTTDFDSATYYWEVVATNADGLNAHDVTLMWYDFAIATWKVDKTVSVPAGTAAPTRIRSSSFTPTDSGAVDPTWRCVQMPNAFGGSVKVFAARVVVVQTGATKTKLFIPMSSRDNDATAGGDAATLLDFQTTTTYGNLLPDSQAIWKYEAAKWAAGTVVFIVGAVIVSSAAGQTVNMALVDRSDNSVVAEVSSPGADYRTVRAVFTTADVVDGHEYEIRLKITDSDPPVAHIIGQYAGYIEAIMGGSLSKLQSYQRTNTATGTKSGSETMPWQRQLINVDNFDSPTAYFEATGREPTLGFATTSLRDHGVADSGTNGSNVTTIAFDSTTRARQRSSSISPDNGDRFIGRIDRVIVGSINVCTAHVIIEAIAPEEAVGPVLGPTLMGQSVGIF